MKFLPAAFANENLGLLAGHRVGPSAGRDRVPRLVVVQVPLGGEKLFAVVALELLEHLVHDGHVTLKMALHLGCVVAGDAKKLPLEQRKTRIAQANMIQERPFVSTCDVTARTCQPVGRAFVLGQLLRELGAEKVSGAFDRHCDF